MAEQNVGTGTECPLCKKTYTDPITLQKCHHTFCLTCLQNQCPSSSSVGNKCPQCKKAFKVHEDGFKAMISQSKINEISQSKSPACIDNQDTGFTLVVSADNTAQKAEEATLKEIKKLNYSSLVKRAALGRYATFGDLYDATTDTFIGTSILRDDMKERSRIRPVDSEGRNWSVKVLDPNNIEERRTQLDICREMELSVLTGLVQPRGHAEYLSKRIWNTMDNNKIYGALVCTMTTAERGIDVSDTSLLHWMSLQNDAAVERSTHVVVGVECGIRIVISLATDVRERESTEIQKAEFSRNLSKFAEYLDRLDDLTDSNDNYVALRNKLNECDIEIYADDNDYTGRFDNLSAKLDDGISFMRDIVELRQSNDDKLQQFRLQYRLYPVSSLVKMFSANLSSVHYENTLSGNAREVVKEIIILADGLKGLTVGVEKFQNLIKDYAQYIVTETVADADGMKNTMKNVQLWQQQAKTCLVNLRLGKQDLRILSELNDAQTSCLESIPELRLKATNTTKQISVIRHMTYQGVIWVTKGKTVADIRKEYELADYFVFFFNHSETGTSFQNNYDIFMNLPERLTHDKLNLDQNNSAPVSGSGRTIGRIAVDTDLLPMQQQSEQLPEGIRICYYNKGTYILRDVLNETLNLELINVAKATVTLKKVKTRPLEYACAEWRCPNSFEGKCPTDAQRWRCSNCNEILEYDLKLETIYCSCGAAPCSAFEYKCKSSHHGGDFTSFPSNLLKDMLSKLKPTKCRNILILGETGVGKSTWINGIVNYATFKSLDEASTAEQVYLIPSSFSITDGESYEMKEIRVGESKDEHFATEGQSSTQEPKAYRFVYGDTHIRLIDTPGIGDTRGMDHDHANFDKIMKYLGQMDKLHGICILLKPNNAKLTVYFKFCLKELLTHLHIDAVKNIVFCFTSCRGTEYKPGDTLTPLRHFLLTGKGDGPIEILLWRENVYCFDNESFRYLCIIKSDVTLSIANSMLASYRESWERSVSETTLLLDNISKRKSHNLKNTVSLNAARNVIIKLTEPLADITLNIEKNIQAIDRQMEKIKGFDAENEDWKSKLMIKVTDLVARDVEYPRMVCTNSKCTTIQTSPITGQKQVIYDKICHTPCNLRGVENKSFPNETLKRCCQIDKDLICQHCGCHWRYHMHITYVLEAVEKEIKDPTVEKMIKGGEDNKKVIQSSIESATQQKDMLENEQKVILNSCAKFGAFLKAKSVVAYNDAFNEYMQFLIQGEKDGEDNSRIESLERMSRCYREQMKIIMAASAESVDEDERPIDVHQVHKLKEKLMQLPLNGLQLKQILDVATSAEVKHKRHETFYNSRSFREKSGKKGEFEKVNILKTLQVKLEPKLSEIHKQQTANESHRLE